MKLSAVVFRAVLASAPIVGVVLLTGVGAAQQWIAEVTYKSSVVLFGLAAALWGSAVSDPGLMSAFFVAAVPLFLVPAAVLGTFTAISSAVYVVTCTFRGLFQAAADVCSPRVTPRGAPMRPRGEHNQTSRRVQTIGDPYLRNIAWGGIRTGSSGVVEGRELGARETIPG